MTITAIAGIATVVKEGYPDFTAWDLNSEHFDPKSTEERPLWYMVDVKFKQKFPRFISLDQLKNNPQLQTMKITQKGSRLSITPVTEKEWNVILKLV